MELATIQKILSLKEHTNADSLELVEVLGYQVVVRKGEFKTGDFCVYVSLDSILPSDNPEFSFMAKTNFRVKTIRLRGEVSQGLCFPMSILEGKKYSTDTRENPDYIFEEGQGVTSMLGILKYEKSIEGHLGGNVRGNFPTYLVPKTDEQNLQSMPKILDELRGLTCYLSLKVDGTSASFIHNDGEIYVCSRNLMKYDAEEDIYWQIEKQYNILSKLKTKGNFAIQGEIVGLGIQKNPMKLSKRELRVFNVYDINNRKYLDYKKFIQFCKEIEIPTVEILQDNFVFNHSLSELIELAKGEYVKGSFREGIVIRPIAEAYSNVMKGRLTVKIINPDYKD